MKNSTYVYSSETADVPHYGPFMQQGPNVLTRRRDKGLQVFDVLPGHKTIVLCLSASLLAYLCLAFVGTLLIVYDTDHFGDTIFILGAAWRVFNGLEPAIDFGFFYGGVTSGWIALAMELFGPSVHAYDQATLLIFATAVLATAVVGWGRLNLAGFMMALLLIATLMFTRHPLEIKQSITQMVLTHSFLYNRIGFVQMVICCIYMIGPSRTRVQEVFTGVLIGGIALSAAYTKPPFVVLIPCLMLGLAIQARWTALAVIGATLVTLVMVVDPGAQRFIASFDYVQEQVGNRGDASIHHLIKKAFQIVLAQPIALMMLLASCISVFYHDRRAIWAVLGIMAVAAGGVGMSAGMGAGGALGQLGLPTACVALIAMTALARFRQIPSAGLIDLGSLILVAGFCLPHLGNLAAATVETYQKRDAVIIRDGPMADYLSLPEGASRTGRASQYRLLAEGMKTLDDLGIGPDYGIVADNGISFEFARGAKPVPGFPMWPRATAPEFAPGTSIPAAADVVMLGVGLNADMGLGPVLRRQMGQGFVLCARTTFWEVYIRRSQLLATCQTG